MRIALIGQAAFGADVLKGLLEQGREVVGVFCPPDRGAKTDPLKEAALAAGLPVFQPGHMREQAAYEAMVSLKPDLGVLAFVTDIVPSRVFTLPKLGSICYHPSILPRYRGSSAINWAVINGEAQAGLSIFWVDEGIDTETSCCKRSWRSARRRLPGKFTSTNSIPREWPRCSRRWT